MSLAADRVTFSRKPDRWQMRPLVVSALALAFAWVVFSFAVFLLGRDGFHFDLPHLQTLVFLTLVFSGQATVYLVRERRHFWQSAPGHWLVLSSVADVVVVSLLSTFGILMAPISPLVVLALIALVGIYLLLLDFLKTRLFRWYALH
jgi:H+-transporting ATPase